MTTKIKQWAGRLFPSLLCCLLGLILAGPSSAFTERLHAVKKICTDNHLEIIPMVFSAGYGGSVLRHNPHLAEGLEVKDATFVVRGSHARFNDTFIHAAVNDSWRLLSGVSDRQSK